MINPNVVHAKTGELVPLSEVGSVEDIAACPANIAALCMSIVEHNRLWTEPTKAMTQAGLAEVQRMLDEWHDEAPYLNIDLEEVTDDMASDMAVFVVQAMAGKLNG
ncbi:hypothetical protein [Klebsiella phage KP8]|uniref:Uncharacterized protein n=1 Tax=Klebsiella phage KP8 TaxID=2099850 RepID=A0A2P1CCK6_9CAUD|nr:hypothetical protein HWB55_gp042 [Klebsiella phage KP8]AVJ48953.1 hypothetical protein [Klebsiella phage KP8]